MFVIQVVSQQLTKILYWSELNCCPKLFFNISMNVNTSNTYSSFLHWGGLHYIMFQILWCVLQLNQWTFKVLRSVKSINLFPLYRYSNTLKHSWSFILLENNSIKAFVEVVYTIVGCPNFMMCLATR